MTTSASGPTLGPPTPAERAAIESAVTAYAQGLADGDVKQLMEVFWDHAVVCGYVGSTAYMEPVTFLYRFVIENGPGAPAYAWRLDDIAVSGHVAVATVHETDYLGDDYVTTLHLIKAAVPELDDRWWIVSKLFNGIDHT